MFCVLKVFEKCAFICITRVIGPFKETFSKNKKLTGDFSQESAQANLEATKF